MDAINKVLLLVGSPRNSQSTSASLGSHLCSRLKESGAEVSTIYIYLALREEGGLEEILAATDAADLIVLAFPLYVDSLPAAVIRVLEALAAHRAVKAPSAAQRFVSVCNCGFPEASQMDAAMAICRRFSREAGLDWAGGLALGGGEAIHGRPLSESGRIARNVILSLDIAAEALSNGQSIPREASDLMARPMVPAWLYRAIGEFGWKKEARKYGTIRALKARPYEEVHK